MVYKKNFNNYGLFPIKIKDITQIYRRQYIFGRDKEDINEVFE